MDIILMAAITVDGKIAKHKDHLSLDWTSNADKKLFVQETKKAGVIIMGRTTYETIGRPLPNRLNIILTSTPQNFESQPGVLEYKSLSPQETISYLKKQGYNTAVLCGGAKTYSDFLESGVVNKLFLTIEPKLFGSGIDLFSQIEIDQSLELISIEKIGENSVFLKYNLI